VNVSRTGIRACMLCAIAWGAACKDEFPNAPPAALSIAAARWFDTVAVRDVDTIQIRVTLVGGGDVTGVQVHWESTDPAKLEVTALPLAGREKDSLTLQLQTVITAHARDSAVFVRAIVDRPGFERTVFAQQITVMERWIAVSAGATHTCGVTVDSVAYCWGTGTTGALGTGGLRQTSIPARVLVLGDLLFASVSAGDSSSCGITSQGLAYCWGMGTAGRLGNGDATESNQLIPNSVFGGGIYQAVTAGPAACAVSIDSLALCWGDDSHLQLGVVPGLASPLDTCKGNISCSRAPRAVTWTFDALSIDVGGLHTCAIVAVPQGSAYCWGTGATGALGNGTKDDKQSPTVVSGGLRFSAIGAGREHTCGVASASGAAYCWGTNTAGQLGTGSFADTTAPLVVTGGLTFRSISAGGFHSCALTTGDVAYCWGLGSDGQLGDDKGISSNKPVAVPFATQFALISAGDRHSCGVTRQGAIYCWGRGSSGQLGNRSFVNQPLPVRIAEPRP